MKTSYDFNGRAGIVTGPASGIGKATALLLAESNAALCLVDRDEAGLKAVADACTALNPHPVLALPLDVSIPEQVQEMVQKSVAEFGRIDFLVTSAGVIFRTKFEDIPLSEWDELMDTNVRGLFLCNQLVVRQMLKQGGGTIANVSSVAGRSISLIGGVHYCTSKHAVIGITRHMARELCNRGIKANVFCPGATHTPMIHDNMDDEELKALEGRIALGRLAQPEEQAKVIAFMLSDESNYLNGACLDSNGGSVML